MEADSIDKERPVIEPTGPSKVGVKRPNLVKFVQNEELVLVGKALAAMKVEAFNPKSSSFQVSWTAASAPQIEAEATYKLLHEICSSESSPPSFLVFMEFVRFFGSLLKMAEGWNMMNLQLLQNFDPGLKHFKHSFFRLLIETSRDFALRQVPKANAAAVSPLSPEHVGQQGAPPPDNTGAQPQVLRNSSNNMSKVLTAGRANDAAGLAADDGAQQEGDIGRIDLTVYTKRFDQMPTWENCVHPIASFKKNENGLIIGCSIMSLQKEFLSNFIDQNLQNSLNLNDLKLEKDWSRVTHQEAVHLVLCVEGGDLLKKKVNKEQGPKEYVVTVDNLLKIMSIQQRLSFGLPVILMGETGCGKTALVNFLARTLEFNLCTLDVHGGITNDMIMKFMDSAIASADDNRGTLVFFDEINAANCMAIFKSIVIDRMYGNTVLPPKVRVISCCNPYRLRRNEELEKVALVYQHTNAGQSSGIQDPMRRLVYRVHPLPESLIDVVSDFGSLSEKSEDIYIMAILMKELKMLVPASDEEGDLATSSVSGDGLSFITAFKDLLCMSQCFVRGVNNGERSVVSMRDVARAAKVFKWFLQYHSKLRGTTSVLEEEKDGVVKSQAVAQMKPHLRTAVILTLGYCYHARLNRNQRWAYRKRISETWKGMSAEVEWINLASEKEFESILIQTQYEFVEQMDRGEGIALNEALRENLFMLLVSVMNQIPILIIGKPGCSKSLAMGVLQGNLNGPISSKQFFQSMPAVEVFAYQCSPLSTPDSILNAFHQARQSNLHHHSTIVCVLLDEVGLAEESPHLPLKVLHKELEDLQGIACVGISNWALDAAKMSRCVTLYRPPPTVDDLVVTAEGIVASAHLSGYLRSLSEAFFEIYKTQKRPDFWGMREFYSTVRVINADLKVRSMKGLEAALEPQVLLKTVMRNFGGCSKEDLQHCIEFFFDRVGMSYESLSQYTTVELIEQNLAEMDARHLMLLTKNNAALRLLFESELLDHSKAEVLFGSTFPNDQSDVFVAMNLQRIKGFMQQPISLIMVHCDSLYESLYDLLNQHYMEYAGQRYVRIAHGSKAKQCPIHRRFRVIVITEISDAYFRLAPPLLNRFEKQIFLRKDLMERQDEALLKKLSKFWNALVESADAQVDDEAVDQLMTDEPQVSASRCNPIAGYHPELLSSLVFTLTRKKGSTDPRQDIDELYSQARERLIQVLTPEVVCMVAARFDKRQIEMKFGGDLVAEYFEKQRHSDLPSFAEILLKNKDLWCDHRGAQVMVLSYSPLRAKIGADLAKAIKVVPTEVSLHELSSSLDIESLVNEFYVSSALRAKAGSNQFLLIHADPVAASPRMIEHCRFVCEKTRQREFKKLSSAASANVFVMLVVHLQRGVKGRFSFDFDSQWSFVFLDSVEPASDLGNMPQLGSMLNMPLIQIVKGFDFAQLLKQAFRSALSRLIYPHHRKPGDLQKQISQIIEFLEDAEFAKIIREWMFHTLETTPKNLANPAEGSVGQDTHWFAAIANATHELALSGTFRAALYNRIVVLVTSLLTALLAHFDRNAGLVLLAEPSKRMLWLKLARASLTSTLSVSLRAEAISSMRETASAQHEVGTDAQTSARPFMSKFPASWFVSRSITGFRQNIEFLPKKDQLGALTSQYQLSKLKEVGFDPALTPALLDDYLNDFAAMHLDYTARLSRVTQQRIMKKILQRAKGGKLANVLEIHKLFWNEEKRISYCICLLNEVQRAVSDAETFIEQSPLEHLDLELLVLVHRTLTSEIQNCTEAGVVSPVDFYRDWLTRTQVVSGLTKDFVTRSGSGQDAKQLAELISDAEPRVQTLTLFLLHVAHPLKLPVKFLKQFCADMPSGKVRHKMTLLAMLKLAQRIGDLDKDFVHMRPFIENWILDVCLLNAEAINDLEQDCLEIFCSLAAGFLLGTNSTNTSISTLRLDNWTDKVEACIANVPGGGQIPRSSCLNLALLRKLMDSSNGDARKVASVKIEALLKDVNKHESHNDTAFATRYAVLCEEAASSQLKSAKDVAEWPNLSLADIFNNEDTSPAKLLKDVGAARWMLSKYAAELCNDPISIAEHDTIVLKVNGLLETDIDSLAPVCRSIRLYLLKCIERQRGVSFLRALLAKEPLSGTRWFSKWREAHDIDFEKFIGAALVPKWNPFALDATKEYVEAKAVVLEMMTLTSTVKLDAFAKRSKMHDAAQQKRDIGGLLLALCQEPGLLSALEKDDRRPAFRSLLDTWLQENTDLPVDDRERTLLRLFAGDFSLISNLSDPDRGFMQQYSISDCVHMENLLRWRFLGHLAAALIAAPPTSLLAGLRQLMFNETPAGTEIFLPGMDEDIRNRVLRALVERGENIWKHKSHWYKCNCGYTFFIGECGRPMETTTCPQCKLPIGGRDHAKTKSTVEDDENDRSPAGYMLPAADKDDKHVSFRAIPSASARAIRLLLHGTLFCGLAAHIPSNASPGTALPRIYERLVNSDSMCTMHQDNEAQFIGTHFLNDWEQMVELMSSNSEDLAAAMHALLTAMSAEIIDAPKDSDAVAARSPDWTAFDTMTRNSWEETIEAKYLINMIKDYDSRLHELYKKWSGADEDGQFVSELKETADVHDFPEAKRKTDMPQVWAYRARVTVDALHARMGVQAGAMQKLPVLCLVLQQPLFSVLRALGMLVGMFEWHQLVMNQFSGRITRKQAAVTTVRDVLASLPAADYEKWSKAFKCFEVAWSIAWTYIERHECMQIPENLRKYMVGVDSSLLWCIPDSTGEGVCPLALTQWLVERNNELVQVASTASGYPARKVSSRMLGQHDVISYDSEDLMRFLHSRCVTYGDGGKLNFDLQELENRLREDMCKPEITVELRAFQWLGESFSMGSELKTVVKQRDLTPEVMERIKTELSSVTLASVSLQNVQMSISFILKSGGGLSVEHAGEMRLSEYMRTVLSEASDSLPSATARREVHLWHIDAFSKLLKTIINKDPMENIDAKYKASLPKDMEAAMIALEGPNKQELAEVMGIFAEKLVEAYIGENIALMDVLPDVLEASSADKSVLQEISPKLPKGLQMKHWAAVYWLLKRP